MTARPLTYQSELRRQPIHLARAALLLARDLAYPELDLPAQLGYLDSLADEAHRGIAAGAPTLTRAAHLSDFLFHHLGFCGNRDDYYDPRNSFLNEVLQRRTGIPITLALVYLHLAERLDIPAWGVSLPGHFIVRIGQHQPVWLDPFNHGHLLDRDGCIQLVRQSTGLHIPFNDDWLLPVQPRAILARMLNNLRTIYLQTSQWPLALRTLEHLRLTHPADATIHRDFGIVYYELGRHHMAALSLNDYLDLHPNAADAPAVRHYLNSLLNNIAPYN